MKRHRLSTGEWLCTLRALTSTSTGNPVAQAQEAERVLSPIWNGTTTGNGIDIDDKTEPDFTERR